MKKIALLIMVCVVCNIYSQNKDTNSLDTLSIVFKAKLFTISQHEFEAKKNLIDLIEKMPYNIYGANEFMFIKIQSNYYCKNEESLFSANWCECDFYICYSIKKNVFYLLGGFKTENTNEFIKEFNKSLFSVNWEYKIKDEKLAKFINYLNLNKIKKARKCFEICKETF